MNIWQAAVLGVVQGVGEFLPISSSAHLVLVPYLFNWPYAGLAFDVALHMGTLLAVVAYFWQEWLILAYNGLTAPRTGEGRMFWYLVAATVPGALAGYLLEEQAETIFRHPLLIALLLIVMGLILYTVDKLVPQRRFLEEISFGASLFIGLSQALAILPGVSRSGITMAAGRLLGFRRADAARFSFLLSTPIILGAGLVALRHLTLADINLPFIVGVITAAVSGFLSIRFLLRFLANYSFAVFAWYRFIAGLVVIIVYLLRSHSGV